MPSEASFDGISSQDLGFFFSKFCCKGPAFTGIEEDGTDEPSH